MKIVLLLLASCFRQGFSYEEMYGSSYRIWLHRKAQSVDFTHKYSSVSQVLWKRDDPEGAREDSRVKVIGSYLVISNLTQEDSGHYTMRDKNQNRLSLNSIDVVAPTRSLVRKTGERLSVSFNMEPKSCNIFFTPESDSNEIEVVRHGRLGFYLSGSDCSGFELLKPCGIVNEHLQKSCSGRIENRDSLGNEAFVVNLEVESGHGSSAGTGGLQTGDVPTAASSTSFSDTVDASKIGLGIGIFLAVISCCTCLRRCCCGKSSSKDDNAETPDDAEPAVHYQEYETEPGRMPGPPNMPSSTQYPSQPSFTPTGPLIHNPPPEPPAYSEVSARVEQHDAPTVPLNAEPEQRFELKGMNFASAPPLSSETTCSDVYTSDKLNFL